MVEFHDKRLAHTYRNQPPPTHPPARTYQPERRCDTCGCLLSKYRHYSDTHCAPCRTRLEHELASRIPPDDRIDQARLMLATGSTFGEVARLYGWNSSAAACSAVRNYEKRRGLPHAGRDKQPPQEA